jgi:hypothetical protein
MIKSLHNELDELKGNPDATIVVSPIDELNAAFEQRRMISKITFACKVFLNPAIQFYVDRLFAPFHLSMQSIQGLGTFLKSLNNTQIVGFRKSSFVKKSSSADVQKMKNLQDEKQYRELLKPLLYDILKEKEDSKNYSLVMDKHSVQVFKKPVVDKKMLCFRAHIKIERPLELAMYFISEITQ